VYTINHDDRNPPHFHARYASHNATAVISMLGPLAARVSPRAFGMAVEWASRHSGS
jgi:phosphomannomutase